jgi:dsRNA-specific ribonuclease
LDKQYQVDVRIGGTIGYGCSANLTTAKQLAAHDLLLKIVDVGDHKKFELPGETKEEARDYM